MKKVSQKFNLKSTQCVETSNNQKQNSGIRQLNLIRLLAGQPNFERNLENTRSVFEVLP